MKLKKLFAGVVAAAMMLTMAVPAFATDEPTTTAKKSVNNGEPVTSVTLKKVYDVKSGTAPADEITITLAAGTAPTNSSATTNPMPSKTTYKATVSSVSTKTSFEFETIDLTQFGFNAPGFYHYTLTETAGKKQGVTYQADAIDMTVSVTNKLVDGEIADGFDYVVALRKNGEKIEDKEAFTNEYNAGSMEVTKKVKGNNGDRAKTFYFKATFTKTANDMEVSGITVKAPNASEAVALNLDFNGGNTATYEFSEGHKQTTTFANIPYGMTVKVEELTAENGTAIANKNKLGDYEVTYTNCEATYGKNEGNATAKVDATVTNESTVNVDTGVILDNAPYIALLTIVAAGAVFMIIKKRRNYED